MGIIKINKLLDRKSDALMLQWVQRISRQVEFSDKEIKAIIAIFRFSYNEYTIENLPENKIDRDMIKNLVSKFEEIPK